MSKLELNQIYLQLRHEIKHSNQASILTLRNSITVDAQNIISGIKSDIDSWVIQLNKREITCYELENLLKCRCAEIDFFSTLNKPSENEEFEIYRNIFYGIIAKSIMNTYFKTLFDSRVSSNKKVVCDNLWF